MEEAAKKIAPFEKAYQEAKEAGDQEAIRNLGITLSREKNKITTQSDYYKDMLDYTTEQLAHTNEKALDYVNNQMPRVYGINYNGTIDQIKTDAGRIGMGVSFNLLDERTIRNLVQTDKLDLPRKQLEKYKDKAWNAKAINSQMIQGILQGETIPEMAARLQNVTDMNEAAANRNARTMTTSAENSGRMDGMKAAEGKGLVYEKQWMATNDDRTRESHAEIDGESVPLDETFSNKLQYPGDPEGDPGEVYNCFIGKTKVGANSRVIRTYKHKYSGQLFTVKTASGIQFTCTPNHPILTSRGWIAANRINDGDDLFVTSVSKKPFFVTWSNPNINHVLARFDTLHKFFYVLGSKRTTDLGVNFHGDIPTSDVEIITQKRLLRKSRNSCRRKSINKFFFILADKAAFCKSTFLKHFGRIWQSSFCDICGKGKSFAFFGRCLRHSKIHGLRPIALLNSGRIQKSYNDGARYAQLLGNSLNGFSGIVFADKVISIDVKFSHCDVFNLQSENGYYFARSIIPQRHKKDNNGIMVIAHNCRCTMVRKLIGVRRKDGSIADIGEEEYDNPFD